jgi:hypothetical protein
MEHARLLEDGTPPTLITKQEIECRWQELDDRSRRAYEIMAAEEAKRFQTDPYGPAFLPSTAMMHAMVEASPPTDGPLRVEQHSQQAPRVYYHENAHVMPQPPGVQVPMPPVQAAATTTLQQQPSQLHYSYHHAHVGRMPRPPQPFCAQVHQPLPAQLPAVHGSVAEPMMQLPQGALLTFADGHQGVLDYTVYRMTKSQADAYLMRLSTPLPQPPPPTSYRR